jgi:hypothetical protein
MRGVASGYAVDLPSYIRVGGVLNRGSKLLRRPDKDIC